LSPCYSNLQYYIVNLQQHIMTRKHRKFATTMSNWVELDALLYQLQRPLKEEFEGV
jgi:regulatory subunit for Cdc7p protein kinase